MSEQEYFTVHQNLTMNIEYLDSVQSLPTQTQFEAEIPAPFIVASEFSQLDRTAEEARKELGNSDFQQVIRLLDSQNSKLNLLLTFMLAQQDDEKFRTKTQTFGASQITYLSSRQPEQGATARVKLFLEHPAAAIYCYAEVVKSQPVSQDDSSSSNANEFEITLKYLLLRDEDQDLLIRAALHQQQKLLRQRSLNRDQS